MSNFLEIVEEVKTETKFKRIAPPDTRKTPEETAKMLEVDGADRYWSYSRISSSKQCLLGYKLSYNDKVSKATPGAYAWLGTLCHDTVQCFVLNMYPYEDMIKNFKFATEEYIDSVYSGAGDIMDVAKFPPLSNKTSEENRDSLFAMCGHYFITTTPTNQTHAEIEPCVVATLYGTNGKKHRVRGYVDGVLHYGEVKAALNRYGDIIYKPVDIDNYRIEIIDYKSSSDGGFGGQELIDKSYQLLTYALAIYQERKIPLDKITVRYDMLKYVNIHCTQKSGKIKIRRMPRNDLFLQDATSKDGKKRHNTFIAEIRDHLVCDYAERDVQRREQEAELKDLPKPFKTKKARAGALKEAKKEVPSMIVDNYIRKILAEESFEPLPEHIKAFYTITNAYIDVPLTPEVMKEYHNSTVKQIEFLLESEEEWKKGETDNLTLRGDIDERKESFFCYHLCDVRDSCPYFAKLQKQKQQVEDLSSFSFGKRESFGDGFRFDFGKSSTSTKEHSERDPFADLFKMSGGGKLG
jgi:hypothetical protein